MHSNTIDYSLYYRLYSGGPSYTSLKANFQPRPNSMQYKIIYTNIGIAKCEKKFQQ